MKHKSLLSYAILILGVSISAILVDAFPNLYQHGDVKSFAWWASFWNGGWREIYHTCPRCNYPILGMFSTAGVFHYLGLLHVRDAVRAFRLLLAAVDGVNVLLIFFLMKKLSIKNAALWAGVTGLLISSWAGGAVWGQIDGISQFFILLTLSWMVLFNLSGKINLIVYIAGSSLLLACLLLTKQLIVFSFASLELLLTVNIFSGRRGIAAAGYWLLHLAFLFVFVFFWDLLLNVDGPYVSHLQMIWSARSGTAAFLSMNGFSIWIFLKRNMMSDAGISLFPRSDSPWAPLLTPRNIGMGLFLLLAAVIVVGTVLHVRRRGEASGGFLGRADILRFVLLLAVVNLVFNVVLTGTHERYLYHFYPFLLLACLGLREFDRRFSKGLLLFVLVGANLYGWFVLRVLWGGIAYRYSMHKYLAAFHVLLLVLLFTIALTGRTSGKRRSGSAVHAPMPEQMTRV